MASAFVAEIAANVKPRRKSVVFIGGNSGTIPDMAQPPVKIGLVQSACTADIAANSAAAEHGRREAASRGANIVCFPELFRSRDGSEPEGRSLRWADLFGVIQGSRLGAGGLDAFEALYGLPDGGCRCTGFLDNIAHADAVCSLDD